MVRLSTGESCSSVEHVFMVALTFVLYSFFVPIAVAGGKCFRVILVNTVSQEHTERKFFIVGSHVHLELRVNCLFAGPRSRSL